MTRTSACVLPLVAFLALACPSGARAELVSYSYQWSITPSSVITGTSFDGSSSSGIVAFALAHSGTGSSVLNGTAGTIPGATLTSSSSALASAPDNFSSPFTLQVLVTDTNSSQSSAFAFAGLITGTLNENTSALTVTFSSPLTQTHTIGADSYAVTIDPTQVTVPDPGSKVMSLIDAFVQVNGAGSSPPPQLPEPSGLALAVAALSSVSLAWRRKALAPNR